MADPLPPDGRLCYPWIMAGETDSGVLLSALLAELNHRSREEAVSADELAAAASDHARWGLVHEAERLRLRARHHQVSALLYGGRAEAWRAGFSDPGRAES